MRQRDDHGATMTTSPADMPVLRRHRERRLRRHLGRRATRWTGVVPSLHD